MRKQGDSSGAVSRNGCVGMADYREMYLKMFRANEEAVNLLIKAQRECEELYISSGEAESEPERSETEQ